MTKNQIDYFEAREKQRANVVSEAQRQQEISIAQQNADTAAYNAATNAAAVAETARHNREMEVIETQNYANQMVSRNQQAAETTRHNVAQEEAARRTQSESVRHNTASESNDVYIANQNARVSSGRAILDFIGGGIRSAVAAIG